MHAQAHGFVMRSVNGLPPLRSVIEFGGRDVNGSVRPLFAVAETYVSIDRIPGPGVDVVGDALSYVPVELVDCVVCCEVLEHTPHARELVQHAMDCLKPGGVFIMTCATVGRLPHSTVTGGPLLGNEFYANVEASDLASWLPDATISVDDNAHDLYCLAVKA
jgi:SAM-dependent methyltransferase